MIEELNDEKKLFGTGSRRLAFSQRRIAHPHLLSSSVRITAPIDVR